MASRSAIEWTEVLCTFSGPHKPLWQLFLVTFRDIRWGWS